MVSEDLRIEKGFLKTSPIKCPSQQEELIKKLREKHPSWGVRKLKVIYKLEYSHQAIQRVIKQQMLVRKRRKKHHKKKRLVEVKTKI